MEAGSWIRIAFLLATASATQASSHPVQQVCSLTSDQSPLATGLLVGMAIFTIVMDYFLFAETRNQTEPSPRRPGHHG